MMTSFIALEGIDGSGKTTQAALLFEFMSSNGLNCILTQEPGGTPLGLSISQFIKSNRGITAFAESLLFNADRAEHVEKIIRPALINGSHVICDRFVGSTLAYQGYGRGLPVEKLVNLCDEACQGLYPIINILLDIPVHTLDSRRGAGNRDAIEASGATFLDRVRKGYLELARKSPSHWAIVDGSRSIREVSMEIQSLVRPYIYG
jgi:dTMP kinase